MGHSEGIWATQGGYRGQSGSIWVAHGGYICQLWWYKGHSGDVYGPLRGIGATQVVKGIFRGYMGHSERYKKCYKILYVPLGDVICATRGYMGHSEG